MLLPAYSNGCTVTGRLFSWRLRSLIYKFLVAGVFAFEYFCSQFNYCAKLSNTGLECFLMVFIVITVYFCQSITARERFGELVVLCLLRSSQPQLLFRGLALASFIPATEGIGYLITNCMIGGFIHAIENYIPCHYCTVA